MVCLLMAGCTAIKPESKAGLDRTVLPLSEPARPSYSELDVRNAKPPARFEVKAPQGAPNVVVVLMDDLGFGGTSAFGGPVPTPTFDRIAKEGLMYN
ncbi:MAG: sulfatase-like hydrolase/transferase, partial [Bryobacteraceae bacterium]|nr:sulfatase-like hydrolase/transferase [Bryobacteraceae bacterium]